MAEYPESRLDALRKKYELLIIFLLAVIVFFLYARTLAGDFVFDDRHNIRDNPSIRLTKITLDGFVKAKMVWVGGGYIAADDPEYDESSYIGYMGFGYSAGINIRFGVLIVGFEYNNCNIKLEDRDFSDYYLGNVFDFGDSGDKSKMSYFNFTLGVNF